MKIKATDGFKPELVEGAEFVGHLDYPIIEKPKSYIIPSNLVPFTKRKYAIMEDGICFYEHDNLFAEVLATPEKFIEEFKSYNCIISPDNSTYIDMPLVLQQANTYINRALTYFYQKNGVYVIPNVSWSDERSYTPDLYGESFAFLGLPKHSIVCVSNYGVMKNLVNRYHFLNGFRAMLNELEPEIVLVYGSMPDKYFDEFKERTKLYHYDNWTKKCTLPAPTDNVRICYAYQMLIYIIP